MTLSEAAAKGIRRVRHVQWIDPFSYLKINIIEGQLGVLGYFYALDQLFIGHVTPEPFVLDGHPWLEDARFEEYTGGLMIADKE